MLKSIKFIAIAMLILSACGNKDNSKVKENQVSADQKTEIQNLENLTNELENQNADIKNTAKELENILDEIDK